MTHELDLNLMCWTGYESPEIINRFSAQQNIKVHTESIVSDATAAARVSGIESQSWDIINLNNPFSRDVLHPAGLIHPLPPDRFECEYGRLLPQFEHLYKWTRSANGDEIIGVGQRFGPFNIVINENFISRNMAQNQGFALADDSKNEGRYGVLEYDDFNIFHICIASGLNPFLTLNSAQLDTFENKARQWFSRAAFVTANHIEMNHELVSGNIGFYLSGGMYTASPARRDGHRNVLAITPRSGPIDGKGAIVFMEVTSILAKTDKLVPALAFLDHILTSEVALALALSPSSCNPITQMGDPAVFKLFSKTDLDLLQWDTLEDDISHCAHYKIPPSHSELLSRLQSAKRA